MTYAYDERYLDEAMMNLGDAIDVAVNQGNIDADEFMGLFIAGGLAEQFGNGVPKYICGMTGVELCREVLERAGLESNVIKPDVSYESSPEYWSGWILAYYQWKSNKSFRYIHQNITMKEVLNLYPTLHEASEEKFVDVVNVIIERHKKDSNLQFLRRMCGYSQRVLAKKSGVSLRMIQQYEQGVKDIHKASVSNLLALSKILGCSVEDILE